MISDKISNQLLNIIDFLSYFAHEKFMLSNFFSSIFYIHFPVSFYFPFIDWQHLRLNNTINWLRAYRINVIDDNGWRKEKIQQDIKEGRRTHSWTIFGKHFLLSFLLYFYLFIYKSIMTHVYNWIYMGAFFCLHFLLFIFCFYFIYLQTYHNSRQT